jgi:2-succinyl-6-hydroxy-2,4-cyclohexadiene-1-carboxylate synthase
VAEDLLLLHGFAGTHHAYDAAIAALPAERYRPLAPDLPGHGNRGSAAPAPDFPGHGDRGRPGSIDFATCLADLAALAPARFVLCGYSLGGRLALHLALAHPERVERLILVSTTAGIEDPVARAGRRRADEALAARIEREPVAAFVRQWSDQPLFAGEPEPIRSAAAADHARNSPAGLAAALRGLGTGAMEPVWGRLGELPMPVAILVGGRDEKFTAIGRRLAASLPAARLDVVAAAGHRLLHEAPGAVAQAIAGEPTS